MVPIGEVAAAATYQKAPEELEDIVDEDNKILETMRLLTAIATATTIASLIPSSRATKTIRAGKVPEESEDIKEQVGFHVLTERPVRSDDDDD